MPQSRSGKQRLESVTVGPFGDRLYLQRARTNSGQPVQLSFSQKWTTTTTQASYHPTNSEHDFYTLFEDYSFIRPPEQHI